MSAEDVKRFQRWVAEVRDPATANADPEEVIRAGKVTGTYRVAPIPGGWAWQADAWRHDGTGGGTPWRGPLPDRAAAVAAALVEMRRIGDAAPAVCCLPMGHKGDHVVADYDRGSDIGAFTAAVEARQLQPDLLGEAP